MNTKQLVLETLLGTSQFISGNKLASDLHLSRNAIWKAIHALRQDGYTIDSHKHYGYKLVGANTKLDKTLLYSALSDYPVFIYDSVDSTNTQAKLYADKHSDDVALFISKQQTSGRGRFSRTFYSPKDTGIYLSVLYRSYHIKHLLHLTTPLSAVAVLRAIKKTTGITVSIKWINDLFYQHKKIGGILTESIMNVELNLIEYIVIGIGINVYHHKEIPQELEHIIGYLSPQTININQLILAIIDELLTLLDQLPDISFLDDYRQHCYILNQQITIFPKSDSSYHAKAIGITDNGELIIQKEDGTQHTLHYGEVSTRLD
ncbi:MULTISPECIES: biotin--[acetyl-CoA-carboxylase] ligase [unclassified Granulicatella]|uniref:biotin--[acetyl-CoA-carboxylase] ligase n=1 Tax=unclassified Granulicatella TaxID=2630493 RepID=UPI0010733B2A|nr:MULTISPECIES: biotin--[acetyl-CoA-carboxylase] ligase [unclassified Granulicatella]MBF0780375.1 biotin--[acetyl-CoA-carboxylase] ligase [Granulicatella sp. 19428wC4_WM01]TFU95463.1 biotin--[acetyl-CoA-carboxylase] ligase [Granulicatella sp. WM01]